MPITIEEAIMRRRQQCQELTRQVAILESALKIIEVETPEVVPPQEAGIQPAQVKRWP